VFLFLGAEDLAFEDGFSKNAKIIRDWTKVQLYNIDHSSGILKAIKRFKKSQRLYQCCRAGL